MQAIQDAQVLNEESDNKTSSLSNKQKTTSTTINVDEKKSTGEQKVKVDFVSGDYADDLLKQKAKRSDASVDKKPESVEDLRAKILEEEKKSQFSREDFEDVAEFLIDIVDVGIGTGLRLWAGDTIDAPYSISTDKKNKLKKSLTLILIKYQAKFPIEFIFIVGLVIAYIVPFRNAQKFRREKKQYLEENPEGEYKIPETRLSGAVHPGQFNRAEYMKKTYEKKKAEKAARKAMLDGQENAIKKKEEELARQMQEAMEREQKLNEAAQRAAGKGEEQSEEEISTRLVPKKRGPKEKPRLPILSKRQGQR